MATIFNNLFYGMPYGISQTVTDDQVTNNIGYQSYDDCWHMPYQPQMPMWGMMMGGMWGMNKPQQQYQQPMNNFWNMFSQIFSNWQNNGWNPSTPAPTPAPVPSPAAILYGTNANESFTLNAGNQTLYASGGNDTITVNSAGNTIYGQNGRDYVRFNSGAINNVYVNDGSSPMSDEIFFAKGAAGNTAYNYDASGVLGARNGTGTAVFQGKESEYIVYRDIDADGGIKVVKRLANGDPNENAANFLYGYTNVYFSQEQ